MTEIFLGALPRSSASQAAVEVGLHNALLEFAGVNDRSAVKLRLHTKSSGEGRGFGFAWLPDASTAQRLVAATEIFFNLNGVQTRAGIRAARCAGIRAAPSTEPGQRLRVTFMALSSSIECSTIVSSFDAWREGLKRFGIGLEVEELETLNQLERVHYSDVIMLLWLANNEMNKEQVEEWTNRAHALGDAGRTVLVVEMSGRNSQGDEAAQHASSLSSSIRAKAAEALGKGSRVDVMTSEELCVLYQWRKLDEAAHVCDGAREAAAISTLAVRRAVARCLSSPLKVFVADCDGTLWDGVASEDGPHGVKFGPAQLALQRALARLQQSGRLICLASKNEESDVLEVFKQRNSEMALRWPHLTEVQVESAIFTLYSKFNRS